jgi:hypothetical protein
MIKDYLIFRQNLMGFGDGHAIYLRLFTLPPKKKQKKNTATRSDETGVSIKGM